jgi:hypothetical protein
MENLFERKSTVARLLAQENLHIVHRAVPTAYFDLENRMMVLPNFKEMDAEMYDLLCAHEVGHALNTPKEGWHNATSENKALKSYLNVIEDARIERMMKVKYPGLRHSFNVAYKKLHDKDFFGLSGVDVKKMMLIDRINVFYKLGAHVRVPFNPTELKFLDRINLATSWEDVETIAKDLYQAAIEERKNRKEEESQEENDDEGENEFRSFGGNIPSEDEEENEEDFFDEEGESDNETDDFDLSESDEDFDSEEKNDSNLEEESDSVEEETEDTEESSSINAKDYEADESIEDQVQSVTDSAFRSNEQDLIDMSETIITALVPSFQPGVIIPAKLVHAHIQDTLNKHIKDKTTVTEYNSFNSTVLHAEEVIYNNRVVAYKDFVKRSTAMIDYMVKEFEMRKNASQLSRTQTSKSGEIDSNKLARYGITSDIFKRINTIKEGKSHGLVMFVDLSGSMSDCLIKVFEQAIALTMFCKKVNIPFDVYGFSNNDEMKSYYPTWTAKHSRQAGHLAFDCEPMFHLKHYLSSNMNMVQYREACMNMIYLGNANKRYYVKKYFMPPAEELNGTPLDPAIVASIDIVSKFKTINRLDNVNCIFLTDGVGSGSNMVFEEKNQKLQARFYNPDDKKVSFYVQYPNTNIRVLYNNLRKDGTERHRPADFFTSARALIEVAKKVTGAKYTGYYITSKAEISHHLIPYEFKYINRELWDQQKKDFRKVINKQNFISSAKFGFDEYFFVAGTNLDIKEEKIEVAPSATKSAMTKAFMNSLKGRNLQRMFLNRFMQNIAA